MNDQPTGKYGAGGRSILGTDKVLIYDELGPLYGWRTIRDNPKGASTI
jgi:hypothetical protein